MTQRTSRQSKDDRPEISIGLLWHSAGAGNLGVGALTVGNLISAKLAAEAVGLTPRFTILHFPSDMERSYISESEVEIFDITRRSLMSPGGYWTKLSELDCILDIGAGDSFADIYGAKRFAFLWLTKALAYLRGVPLLFSPQTIGPFTRQPYKMLAAWAMKRAFAVVARDPGSMDAVRIMAPRARAAQAVDVAFQLPFTAPRRAKDGLLHVGVNVSALLFHGGYGGANDYGLDVDYVALMRRFIADMAARPGVVTHLICHVISAKIPKDDDARIADLLAAEFPGVIRAPNFQSPSEAKSYIAGMDFLVAARMHACIAAYSAGVPVVPIAYSRKFSGLFKGVLNYPHQVPVKGLSTDEALAFLHHCLAERDLLKRDIAQGHLAVVAALGVYDATLRDLFTSVRVSAA